MLSKCRNCDFYQRSVLNHEDTYSFTTQTVDIERADSVIVFPEYIKYNNNFSLFITQFRSTMHAKTLPIIFLSQCTSWTKHSKYLKDIKYCFADRMQQLDFSNKILYFFGAEVGEIFNIPKPLRFYKSYKIEDSFLGKNIIVYAFPSYYRFVNDLVTNIEFVRNSIVLPQGVDETKVEFKDATSEDVDFLNSENKLIIDIESNNILNQYDPNFVITHLGVGTFKDDIIYLIKDQDLIHKLDVENKTIIGFNTAWDVVALLAYTKKEHLINSLKMEDVMLLSYLLNENRYLSTGNNLKSLSIAEFGLSEYYEPLRDMEKIHNEMVLLDKKIKSVKTEVTKEKYRSLLAIAQDNYYKLTLKVNEYNAKDVFYTKKLYQKYFITIEQLYDKDFLNFINKALLFTTKLRMRGVGIDYDETKKLYEEQLSSLKEVEENLKKLKDVNWKSNQEAEAWILEKYSNLSQQFEYTNTNQIALSDEMIEKYIHNSEINKYPELIHMLSSLNEYRTCQKSLSFTEIVLEKTKKDFLHGNFSLTRTVTGRIASSDPNMQQFPKDIFIRVIKSRFGDNGSIYEFDYSQAELRMFAMIAGEERLAEAIKTSKDVYAAIAALALRKEESLVTKTERDNYKLVALSSIYGITPYGLAYSLKITKDEAEGIQNLFFNAFPKFKEYINTISSNVFKDKFVMSTTGRYRRFPELAIPKFSLTWKAKGRIMREAVNFDAQGSSSDVTLINAIRLDEAFYEKKLESRIINLIHDSIMIDIKNSEKDEVLKLYTEIALTVPDLIKKRLRLILPLSFKSKVLKGAINAK